MVGKRLEICFSCIPSLIMEKLTKAYLAQFEIKTSVSDGSQESCSLKNITQQNE